MSTLAWRSEVSRQETCRRPLQSQSWLSEIWSFLPEHNSNLTAAQWLSVWSRSPGSIGEWTHNGILSLLFALNTARSTDVTSCRSSVLLFRQDLLAILAYHFQTPSAVN